MSTTQLQWPLALVDNADGSRSFAEVPTDSDSEVLRSAGLVAQTRPEQVEWAPDMGVPSGVASIDGPGFAQVLEASLRAQEPRLPDGFYIVDVSIDQDARQVHLVAGVDRIPVIL